MQGETHNKKGVSFFMTADTKNTRATNPVGALKLKAACEYLGGLSVPTIHRLIERGLIRPNRSLRHLLFPIAELDRFLRDG